MMLGRQVTLWMVVLLVLLPTTSFAWSTASSSKTRPSPPLFMTEASTTGTETSAVLKPDKDSIVTIDYKLHPVGDFVPEPLFDMHGEVSFVLGGGNYLPGIHDLVLGMEVGQKVTGVELDAGWGARRDEMIAILEKSAIASALDDPSQLQVGMQLYMANGLKCVVTEVMDDTFTIDANPPLAGSSYKADVSLLRVEQGPTNLLYQPSVDFGPDTKYHVATFALGCFWGAELAFMRQKGVVGTKAGYTQGSKDQPSYKEVCSGTTGHTEAVMVIYDPDLVSFAELVDLTLERLGDNVFLKDQVGNDKGTQYRHGIYYHNDEQMEVAKKKIEDIGDGCMTEVMEAKLFYPAEDYHQQYLLKGGQSAKKGDRSTIRCYG